MCQNVEASVCRYFSEGEVQVEWVLSSILQGMVFSSTGSMILWSRGLVGVGCVVSGDWVEFVCSVSRVWAAVGFFRGFLIVVLPVGEVDCKKNMVEHKDRGVCRFFSRIAGSSWRTWNKCVGVGNVMGDWQRCG